MNKEQLRMQMLAGIITEGQYKEKLNEESTITPEQATDTAKKISDNLSQEPEQLKQAINKANQAGISMDMIKQAASQLKQGKDPEEVLKSISKNFQEEVNEVSVADAKRKNLWDALTGGAGLGAMAGGLGLLVTGPIFWPMAILALAGASIGYLTRSKNSGGKVRDVDIIYKAQWEFKNQMNSQGRENILPDPNLFYIVDNGDTPKELKGKEIWRYKILDRDVVGDKKALWNSTERLLKSDYSF